MRPEHYTEAIAVVDVHEGYRPFVQRGLSLLLWGGSLAWLGVLGLRIQERLSEGLPWRRLSLILGAVALFTAWAAWLLGDRRER